MASGLVEPGAVRVQQSIFLLSMSPLSFCAVCLLCFSLCLPLSLSFFPYLLCTRVTSSLPYNFGPSMQVRDRWSGKGEEVQKRTSPVLTCCGVQAGPGSSVPYRHSSRHSLTTEFTSLSSQRHL